MPSFSANESEVWRVSPHVPGGRRVGHLLQAILISALYLWLIYYFVPLEQWADLFRYVSRYSLDPYYEVPQARTILDYASGEYGWHIFIKFLFYRGFNFENAFFFISTFGAFLTCYVVIRRSGSPLLLLVLVNPSMMDFFVSQVRSALAYSLVFWAVSTGSFVISVSMILAASTIHTSMMLLLVPVLAHRALQIGGLTNMQGPVVSHLGAVAMIFAAVILSSAQIYILDFLGDRRAAYAITDFGVGALFTIGWSLIAVAFYVLNRHRSSFETMAAVFFFAMFVMASSFGFYAHRYIPYALPFVCLALGSHETDRRRQLLFVVIYLVFSGIYFAYWTA